MDSMEELVQVKILPYSSRYFRIDKSLLVGDRVEILLSLVQNLDVFAWSPYEVLRVDLAFVMHRLNVDPLIPPKKQRRRKAAKPQVEAVRRRWRSLKG